jgi:uncharacterized repeat protein (TIGR01451 family)
VHAAVRTPIRTDVVSDTTDSDHDGEPDFAEIRLGIFALMLNDSDQDSLSDATEDANHNGVVDPGETDPANSDTDGDGIIDGLDAGPGGPSAGALSLDADNDGINDSTEVNGYYVYYMRDVLLADSTVSGTVSDSIFVTSAPDNPDTDADSLNDGAERFTWHTNPDSVNSDAADGWTDGQEVTYGTNPNRLDTDGDGRRDGIGNEDASDVDGDGVIAALDADSDNDGLYDGEEDVNHNGIVDAGETDPNDYDSDNDGLSDGYEFRTGSSGTLAQDTDGDGIYDGFEITSLKTDPNNVDTDGDGINDGAEGIGGMGLVYTVVSDTLMDGSVVSDTTLVKGLDTDGDGLINALDSDSDNDGRPDSLELLADTVYVAIDSTATDSLGMTTFVGTFTDTVIVAGGDSLVYNADADGDSLSDGFERAIGTNPSPTDANGDSLADGWDTDGDGLRDGDEVRIWGTNPLAADTDQDGTFDGSELPPTADVPSGDADLDSLNNALDIDSDNDGLTDTEERFGYFFHLPGATDSMRIFTNPYSADTDGDSLFDGEEVKIYGTNPTNSDTDGDGLSDGLEARLATWAYPPVGLPGSPSYYPGSTPHPIFINPLDTDTDDDGVDDFTEYMVWHTNPSCLDTDGDGIADGDTLTVRFINAAGDTVDSIYVESGDPNNPEYDTDNDDLANALDANSDWRSDLQLNTDMRDQSEVEFANSPLNRHMADGWILNPGRQDTDGDGYDDGLEIVSNSDPLDARDKVITVVLPADADSDGVYNHEELVLGTLPNVKDTDGDGLWDGEELDPRGIDEDHNGITNDNGDGVIESASTNPLSVDTDSDALTDSLEYAVYGTDPRCRDTDNDGVSDSTEVFTPGYNALSLDQDLDRVPDNYEFANGTAADSADSDADGLNDFQELVVYRTNARSDTSDADADGLLDQVEVLTYHSDPNVTDSDHDGLADGTEVTNGTNPADADTDGDLLRDNAETTTFATSPTNPDTDGDGLPDGAELSLGTNPVGTPDTDGDGVNDGAEVVIAVGGDALNIEAYNANPTIIDSDKDGYIDGAGGGGEVDGLGTHESVFIDTDGDGGSNAMDKDSDDDWLIDNTGTGPSAETYTANIDGDAIPNVLDADSDNDGLSDPLETGIGTSLTDADTDNDGLLDGREYFQRDFHADTLNVATIGMTPVPNNSVRVFSDPKSFDTDGDGLFDGFEAGLVAAQNPAAIDSPTVYAGLVFDVDGTSDSDPRWADTDGDGVGDSLEVEPTGLDAGYGVTMTNPRDADTDNDGLLDGSEPAILTNALNADSDTDGLYDGTEVGLTMPQSASRGRGTADTDSLAGTFIPDADPLTHTLANDFDTDDDGLIDGDEDTNETDPTLSYNGRWDIPEGASMTDSLTCGTIAETNPLDADTDNDGVNDLADASPTCSFIGGEMYTASDSTSITVAVIPGSTTPEWTGSGTATVMSTGIPNATRIVYLQPTNLMWTQDIPGGYYSIHGDPYDSLARMQMIPFDSVAITPTCVPLIGSQDYTLTITLPAGTLPGIYQGTVFVVANADSDSTSCPADSALARSTLAPYDSFTLTVTVPEREVADINSNDGLPNGVGSSQPLNFFLPGPSAGEMHLAGYPFYPGAITGEFHIANPNTYPDADSNGVNDVNGLPALPNPRWIRSQGTGATTDTAQGNVALFDVRFRYVPTSGPVPVDTAITFSPMRLDTLGLGDSTAVLVMINTTNLPGCTDGGFTGTVQAYLDTNGDSTYTTGELVLDAFELDFELKNPDLDIYDNKGDLTANALTKPVVFGSLTPSWTIVATNPASQAVNLEADPADGPGCDEIDDVAIYNPTADSLNRFTSLGMATSDSTISGGVITLYNVVNPAFTMRAQIFLPDTTMNRIAPDSAVAYGIRVDPASLTDSLPTGTYAPYYGSQNPKNGFVYLAGVGASTKSASFGDTTGFGLRYNGSPALGTLIDSFEVAISYTAQAVCRLETVPLGGSFSDTVDVGQSKQLAPITIRNTGTVAQSGLVVTVGPLTNGTNTLPATATLNSTTLGDSGTTDVFVTVNASATQPGGTYTGNVVVTSNCGGTVTIPVTVFVTTSSVTVVSVTPTSQTGAPGSAVTYMVTIQNNGTATISQGELSLSFPPFTGPGGVISNIAISPDPSSQSIPPGGSVTFTATVAIPSGQTSGTYTTTVTATPGSGSQVVTLIVSPSVLITTSPSSLNITAGGSSVVTVSNPSNTSVNYTATTNCPGSATTPQLVVTPTSANGVPAGDTRNFTVSVPATGPMVTAGTYNCVITFIATAVDGGAADTALVPVIITVPRAASIAFGPTPPAVDATPGQTVTFQVTLNNTGNTDIAPGELSDIGVSVFQTDVLSGGVRQQFRTRDVTVTPDPSTVGIPRGGSATFTITVQVPRGQAPGRYTATVTATGNASDVALTASTTLTITVGFTGGVQFSVNPVRFNETPRVDIRVPADAVRLDIYDLLGNRLVTVPGVYGDFTDDLAGAGNRVFSWDGRDEDGRDVASGTYTIVVKTSGGQVFTAKLMVIR